MKLTTIGMDLAKNVFQVHGADDKGRSVLKKQLKRAQVIPYFANLTPCKIGIPPWQCALLGEETAGTGSHGAADCSAVR